MQSADSHLTWATGWMLTRSEGAGSEVFEIRVWRAEAGMGTPLLWASNDQFAWMYFGAQPPSLLQDVERSTVWVERFLADPRIASDLSGVFALLAIDFRSGRIVVAGDRLGVQPVYYMLGQSGMSYIATHLTWLLVATHHDGSVDDESFLTHFSFGYALSATQTVYKNVLRLVPAGSLVSSGTRTVVQRYSDSTPPMLAPSIPELVSSLQESMRSHVTDSAVFLPLTAGKDSLCLAAVAPDKRAIHAGTFGAAESADRVQGEQIAAALQVPYRSRGLCGASSLKKWTHYVALHSGGLATASYVDMARFVSTIVPRRSPVVMGEGGECVREFFRTMEGPLDALTRHYMTPPDYLRRTLHTRLPDVLGDYPASILARAKEAMEQRDDEAFAVEFYRSVRMPGNFALRHSVLSTIRPKISPFLDRQFIEGTYGLPRRWFHNSTLHRTIVQAVKPAWLHLFDHPITTGPATQMWDERFRGESGRQLASQLMSDLRFSDDLFNLAGVDDLMTRTVARPDRAMHHLLRVVSFAAGRRMLRAGAEELGRHISERCLMIARQTVAGPSSQVHASQPVPAVVS
jgi:hypothetical protein